MFQTLAFVALASVASADCAIQAAEAAEASLFQLSRARQPELPPAFGAIGTLLLDDVHQGTYNLISRFVRGFYEACQVVGLYTSTVETFPLIVVKMNNFSSLGLGVTSYWPILSPDFFEADTYLPYTSDEYTFLIRWQADLDLRIGLFAASTILYKITPMAIAYHTYTASAARISIQQGPQMPFVQGYGDNWQDDGFAGQLVGNTFLACMLEKSGDGWALDLSGAGTSAAPVQVVKRKAVSVAPSSLLKAIGHFKCADMKCANARSLQVVAIEVQDPSSSRMMRFSPEDGAQWSLAKTCLYALAIFVIECYHTGIHLFAGAVTSAIRKAVPAGTSLGQAVSPNTLQTIFALFEQAAILHSTHGSVFSGRVWSCNITAVWAVTREMSQYYLNTAPQDILGMSDDSPDWWAGRSFAFIEPISTFASFAAEQAVNQASEQSVLQNLQEELASIGIWTSQSSLDVTSAEGLAALVRNFLFVAGICHSHMYLTREVFTPLAGFTDTEPFLPYLRRKHALLGFWAIVELCFPTVPATVNSMMIVAYATASGFTKGVPELGDGKYPNSTELNGAVASFQQGLKRCRQEVYEMFGGFHNKTFVPGYLYPVDVPKPFGYAITQTAYV